MSRVMDYILHLRKSGTPAKEKVTMSMKSARFKFNTLHQVCSLIPGHLGTQCQYGAGFVLDRSRTPYFHLPALRREALSGFSSLFQTRHPCHRFVDHPTHRPLYGVGASLVALTALLKSYGTAGGSYRMLASPEKAYLPGLSPPGG